MAKVGRIPKYNQKIVDDICSIIEKDSYTIPEICKMVNIKESTYHRWRNEKKEFNDAIKKAQGLYDEFMLKECEKSLNKLIKGYEYEETVSEIEVMENGEANVTKMKTTKKHVAPNLGAVIHFQTNKDPDNWKNKQSTELTGKDGNEELKQYHLLLTKASAKE
jgi:hypothetical protein